MIKNKKPQMYTQVKFKKITKEQALKKIEQYNKDIERSKKQEKK